MFRPCKFSAYRRGLRRSLLASLWVAQFAVISLHTSAQPADGDGDPKADSPPSMQIEISDEPKTIDPVTLLPENLAADVTAAFRETSLTEVAQWLRQQQISVLIDGRALDDEGILTSEPITDALHDEPLYLLLNRLQTAGLSWYVSDGNVHITTLQGAEDRLSTQNYNLGELLDADFDAELLTEAIVNTVSPLTWEDAGGPGSYILLADVLFVRQSDAVQREVAGLLAALRNHGRRTFTLDAPQNERLRQRLDETISVNLRGVPLVDAIARLSELAETDIRLDHASLRGTSVRLRTPITLEMTDQRLRIALLAMLRQLDLAWVIRDGVLWVVSRQDADELMKTAVYDVRDLARDREESESLALAIENQTSPDDWEVSGGIGTMRFPKPGVLVIYQTEQNHDDVLQLLENYRLALRSSKPRRQPELDPTEVLTHYYRMPTGVAEDLRAALPTLLQPETWRSEEQPEAPGTIVQLKSRAELLHLAQPKKSAGESDGQASAVVVDHSVLIIRQMRQVHEEIPGIIRRIEYGDGHPAAAWPPMGGMGGGMGGMGGMGGGATGGFGGGFM